MISAIGLNGLRGDNPLAFLAALGTLRVLTVGSPSDAPRMSWRKEGGAWRPALHFERTTDAGDIVVAVEQALHDHCGPTPFEFADDTCIDPEEFRRFAEWSAESATARNRRCSDFTAALGCEALRDGQGRVQDTALRTMSGAGHQHFLKVMRDLTKRTEAHHIRKALFEPWRYDDPVEKMSMRWDPADDVRYALRWANPSGDPARRKRGSTLGANRLAIEALPLCTTVPVGTKVETVGFRGRTWTWPVWEHPLSVDTVRSLLALPELQKAEPCHARLRALGIPETYRSKRLTVGQYRNFSPARAV